MAKERVLILSNNSFGFYRFRKELLEALVKRYEVYVSTPDDGYIDEMKAIGIKFVDTPINRRGVNPFKDLALLRRYRFMMREIKPDVVLAHTAKPNIYGNLAARRLKIPVISAITGLGDGFHNKNIVGSIVKFLYRVSLRKTVCITFPNRDDEGIMRRAGIIRDHHRVLFVSGSGVNLQDYQVLEYPESDEVSFLYMGRIKASKGVGELIEASRKLKLESKSGFNVTLMGMDEEEVSMDEAIKEGVIRYIGLQKDIVPHVRAAHCIVLPSYTEGMSNSLLEGAASGRPLITTTAPGCKEAVDEGVNGFLCQPADAHGLYECMKRFTLLSNDERLKMGLASRRKVENEFDRNLVVDIMLKEIAMILEKRSKE